MNGCTHGAILLMISGAILSSFAGPAAEAPKPITPTEEKTALDLFSWELRYTGESLFRHGLGGSQDALANDFSYGHRFALTGPWYFRGGFEFERYDFGSSRVPVPSKLQSLSGVLALEYVVHNYAGAALELHPGFYFENELSSRHFDLPWNAFVTIPIVNKVYGVVGVVGATYYQYPVLPIGGIIWLINDKVRLEGVFPKASLVYNRNEDWEFRVVGELNGGGYRIDRNAAIDPRLSGAVVEYDEYRLGAQITYSHFKPFDIVVNGGYTFKRDFNFHRAGEKFDLNGAPYFRIGIDAEF